MKWRFIFIFLCNILAASAQEFYFRQMPSEFGSDVQQINVIFQGADQMVWLGTDRGLFSFDGRTYRHTSRPDGADVPVTAIAECPNREIWAGYKDGFLQVITNKGFAKIINTDSIKAAPVTKILFNKNGIAFIATYGSGIWRMDQELLRQIHHPHVDKATDIYDALIDRKGKIWMGTDHGIIVYSEEPDPASKLINREAGLPDEIVTELHETRNGDIWVGFYDYGFGTFQNLTNNIRMRMIASPGEGRMISIINGYGDEVWLATERSVFHHSKDEPGHKISLPLELKDRIEDILFDRTGNLWVSSGNKLFMANTKLESRDPGIKGIQAITELNNILWLGCENALYSFDLKHGKVMQHLKKENPNILSIYHDPQGLLWIGTFGQGLYIYDPVTSQSNHLTEEDGLSNNSILNIDGRSNTVWLATLGGITEINWSANPVTKHPTVTLFGDKFSFPAGYVYDIHVDQNGKVWFGTDGKGLYFLEDNRMSSFTKPLQYFNKDSFDLRTIYSIAEGDKSNIWVSASKGHVLKLDESGHITDHIASEFGSLNSLNTSGKGEVLLIREGIIQVNDPVYGISSFGPSTGFSSFAPNINSTAKGSDGSVWIADTDKILHYKPTLSDTAHFVQMHIVDVTPGTLNSDVPIRLRPDSNFIDFRFTGLWYPDPQSVRYRYMLKGHDNDWIYTREGRAVYSKLSPGTYEFIVAGSHNEDFTHSVTLKRDIIVMPPFYLTWWFILGSIALVSFLIYRIIRDRIARINRFHTLEKEKTTLQLNAIQAQVNPHFLFNSFNTLSGIIEEDQKAAVDYVDQLSAFFRGVLLHRNAELITLSEEIETMRNYIYILIKRYGENIRISEEINSTEGFIAPLTLQLLVENAIKHNIVSREKPLNITISINDDWVVVSNPIQPKFQSLTESTGFGLSSLLARYQYLTEKKIVITNDSNTFTVQIPIIQLKVQS